MSGDAQELVYAVPRETLFDGVTAWRGVRRADVAEILRRVDATGTYVPRAEAERDRTLKQIIPYLILRDGGRIFLMKRTRAGGDARLHDHYTIGIGGHLNPGDDSPRSGLEREWHEELDAAFVPPFEFVGLLNDDTVDVGVHHLGLVYLAEASGRPVGVRETDKLSGSFERIEVVRAAYDLMETWSQLVLDAIDGPNSAPEGELRRSGEEAHR
ncbi:MAG TPA: NUDIX domain-containing protein [Candidatus Limnocylindrales bacterium]